jgi:hypothetical protein
MTHWLYNASVRSVSAGNTVRTAPSTKLALVSQQQVTSGKGKRQKLAVWHQLGCGTDGWQLQAAVSKLGGTQA